MKLTTNRLVLRNWELNDDNQLYEYASRADFSLYSDVEPHTSIYETISVIKSWLNEKEYYAIFKKNENKLIGGIILTTNGFSNLSNKDDECEISFWIVKEHAKEGFMEEAANAIVSRAFKHFEFNTIWCEYYDGDEESKKTQELLGFIEHEEVLDVQMSPVIKKRIIHINLLTKEKWLTTK